MEMEVGMKTLLGVIVCAGLVGGCAVAPVDSTYSYPYGYAAPYAYGPYYDYGPYYYGPGYGYYGYYGPPVIVGGITYYSHRHHDWHDGAGQDHAAWRGDHRTVERTMRPAPAPGAAHWSGRTANAPVNRTTRSVVAPSQRAARGSAPPMSHAQSTEPARPAS
jgi:hypothetical protein